MHINKFVVRQQGIKHHSLGDFIFLMGAQKITFQSRRLSLGHFCMTMILHCRSLYATLAILRISQPSNAFGFGAHATNHRSSTRTQSRTTAIMSPSTAIHNAADGATADVDTSTPSYETIESISSIPLDKYDTVLLDMWGVMHDGSKPYEGVLDAVRRLKEAGKTLIIVSNSSKRKENSIKMLEKREFILCSIGLNY